MTNKYVSSGDKQSIVVTGGPVTQGTVYIGTSRAGVYLESGAVGDLVAVAFRGVFTLTKTASQAWTNGQAIYATSAGVALLQSAAIRFWAMPGAQLITQRRQ